MSNFLAIEKTKIVVISVLMLVFGILFVAVPETSFGVLTSVFSWIIIVVGALLVLHFLVNAKVVPWTNLVLGIVSILIGILLLFLPGIYIVLISIGILVAGIGYIANSIQKRKASVKDWWKDLIVGIVQVVLGILLLILNFSAAAYAIMLIFGISLIIDSIFIFVTMLLIHHDIKQIKKETEKNKKDN